MRRRGSIRLGLSAVAACALLVLPQVAQAAPSEEEIAAAKAAEEAAKMSVAQIEALLRGNTCGPRSTSCADQLAVAVQQAYEQEQAQK